MTTSQELARTASALASQPRTLASLIRDKGRNLLCDCSYSMNDRVRNMEGHDKRKIDAMREVIALLRQDSALTFKQICFGAEVAYREDIPEPGGGTPLSMAMQLAYDNNAKQLVVISDGQPDSPEECFRLAREHTDVKIDVFYIGPGGDAGELFMKQLSGITGGTTVTRDLSSIRQLAGEVQAKMLALPAPIAL